MMILPVKEIGSAVLLFLIGIFAVSALIIGGSFYIKTSYPSLIPGNSAGDADNQTAKTPLENTKNKAPATTDSSSSTAQQKSNISDPLKVFIPVFTLADYRVVPEGKIEKTERETDSTGLTQTNSLKFDYQGKPSIYFKKGVIVRGDGIQSGKQTTIEIIGDTLYILDHTSRSYGSKKAVESIFYPVFKYSLPIVQLMEDSQKNLLNWQSTGVNEWQTDWQYAMNVFKPDEKINSTIKITLDPTTNLIDTFSIKFSNSNSWQTVTLTYQRIVNIDNFLTLPKDYRPDSQMSF